MARSSGFFVALFLISALPAAAHHSGAMFDDERTVTLDATVTQLRWKNPHVYIEVETVDSAGRMVAWAIEGLAPSGMRSGGWSPSSLEPGDRIVVAGNPARNPDRNMMLGSSVIREDGIRLEMPSLQNRRGLPPVDLPTPIVADSLSGRWVTRWNPAAASEFFGARARWALTDKGAAAMDSYDASMDPGANCVPEPVPYVMIFPAGKSIRIGDEMTIIRDELGMERSVHMNAKSHDDATYADHGHSIGRWEADTLVVDTTHFSSHRRGLALRGLPSGPGKHLVERFELGPDRTTMRYTYWLEDPEYLAEPRSGELELVYRPDVPFVSEACDLTSASRFRN
jgi:hypothetical protein